MYLFVHAPISFLYKGNEVEDIKKRCQENREELYKTDLHDPGNYNGLISHLERDILECEVKWALGSISLNKVSGGDKNPVELLQIIKDDAVKVLHSIHHKLENSAVATGLEKVSFNSNPKETQCEKMFNLQHNCTYLTH